MTTLLTVSRRLALAGIATMVMFAAGPAHADKPAIYTGFLSNLAVSGYDPVAYFSEGRPVEGKSEFQAEHDGAVWHFASAANRDAFTGDPARYAPQYGGYCAWAVSQGYTAKTDPEVWRIVDGKLYLNYNADVQKQWEGDIPANIKAGDANWPTVLK